MDDFGIRLIDDNATSWRPYSPAGQRSVSHYLRNGVLLASYGARYGVLFDIKYLEEPGYNVFYALIKSGALPVVEREDILSVGSWVVVKDMEFEYVKRAINNGHAMCEYSDIDSKLLVSKGGMHWCGASLPEYDYSKMLGVDYRWLNFIPKLPNGMIPIVNQNYEQTLKHNNIDYFATNIMSRFKGNKVVSAPEFGDTMKEIVQNGADKMLLRVDGASWSLIRIDKHHARLILIDPGYIDPAERIATIIFQNNIAISGIDILSGESIDIRGDAKIVVPAGSMRFIDIEFVEEI